MGLGAASSLTQPWAPGPECSLCGCLCSWCSCGHRTFKECNGTEFVKRFLGGWMGRGEYWFQPPDTLEVGCSVHLSPELWAQPNDSSRTSSGQAGCRGFHVNPRGDHVNVGSRGLLPHLKDQLAGLCVGPDKGTAPPVAGVRHSPAQGARLRLVLAQRAAPARS